LNPDDIAPWKVLGQKWHLLRKGFPPGRPVEWDQEVLEELVEMLAEIAPDGQFLWNNQQLVHLFVGSRSEPWVTLQTKRPEALTMTINCAKNQVALGRIANLGFDRAVDGSATHRDQLRIRFRNMDDLERGDLPEFLREHLSLVLGNK
jgi:excinuclease ABC subunit A